MARGRSARGRRAERRSRPGGGGTKVAVSMVASGDPIQFWVVLSSPGWRSRPRTPARITACISRMRRVLTGRVDSRCRPASMASHVVDDLFDIGAEGEVAGFGVEDLCQRGLRALDPSRGHGLASEVGADQELRVRAAGVRRLRGGRARLRHPRGGGGCPRRSRPIGGRAWGSTPRTRERRPSCARRRRACLRSVGAPSTQSTRL